MPELKNSISDKELEPISLEATGFMPGVTYSGPEDIAALWDEFTREYSDEGNSTHHMKQLNIMHEIAFDGSVEDYMNRHVSSDGDYKDFRRDVEEVSLAVSELVESERTRPINRAVEESLIRQWIELEKQHGLYPPLSIASQDGVSDEEKEAVLEKRKKLLNTKAGGAIAGALRVLENFTIEANVNRVLNELDDSADAHDVYDAAENLFQNCLFRYELGHTNETHDSDRTFSGHVMGYLHRSLEQDYARRTANYSDQSVNAPAAENDETSWIDTIEQRTEARPGAIANSNEISSMIRATVDKWVSKEYREVIYMHHGLDGDGGHTFKEVGRRLGMTGTRAEQLYQKGVAQLQRHFQRIHGISLESLLMQNYDTVSIKDKTARKKASKEAGSRSYARRIGELKNQLPEKVIELKAAMRELLGMEGEDPVTVKDLAKDTGIKGNRLSILLSADSVTKPQTVGALSKSIETALVDYLEEAAPNNVEALQQAFADMREAAGYKRVSYKRNVGQSR